jgi:hypothetical protein
MLTYPDLVRLERALRDRTVLTVYVNGESTDPAMRSRWRLDLRHSFDDIESWLRDSSHSEREAFAACRAMALDELEDFPGAIGAPGWAAFITTGGVFDASTVSVPVPTMAAWSTGPCLSPYVRAIKEARPVIVAVMNGRKARLFRYVDRQAELVDTVRAHVVAEPPSHMGGPPRPGFHSGTRGSTGADEAQRELLEGTQHMQTQVARRIAVLANAEGWIVIGGIPSAARATLDRLAPDLAVRAMPAPSLDVHASPAQVAECAREAASTLRNAYDAQRVRDAMQESERDGGYGATGVVETMRALEEARVCELYVTLNYVLNHAADAEAAIRLAFDHGALVEHVSGEGAEKLDSVGGLAARLRYPWTRAPMMPEVASAGQPAG